MYIKTNMPSLRQRKQRRSRQQKRGGRRSARLGRSRRPTEGEVEAALLPEEPMAVLSSGVVVPVAEVEAGEVVEEVLPAASELGGGRRSRKLRRGRRASRAAQRGGRAVSLKTAVRLLRNYYAKRYA